MKKTLATITFAVFFYCAAAQQINIVGIHQLVDESISENKIQIKARDKQAVASGNEQVNLTLITKLKGTYRTLQQRYNLLGTAISLAEIGVSARPMVSRIISNQAEIIGLVQQNPALLHLGYQSVLEFADQAGSLLGYITGLTLSFGDVNQMRASDRKLLFDYVIAELSRLQERSGNLLSLFRYTSLNALLRAANPFQDYIDIDKGIAEEILQNAKQWK
ncbi:hypothetical protein [Mucilaginibacter sp. HD30]